MIGEYIKMAVKNLRTRPVRSWLTMIGVIIGVFLIVSLMSLSQGIKDAVMKQLNMMGKDLVMVYPGDLSDMSTMFAGGSTLSDDDIKAIKKAQGVENTVSIKWKAEVIKAQNTKKTVLLNGISLRDSLDILKNDTGWELQEGRWPYSGKNELLVGNLVPEDIFPGMKVGSEAVISGRKFEVVGILKSLGSKQDDSQVNLDLDIFVEITGDRKGANFVLAKISKDFSPEQAANNIKRQLDDTRKRIRGSDSPSFSVLTSEKISGIVGNIMGLIQTAILGFASIAIIVGGIGIMNTMYTSVHERIKEIGIMKAVGAKNRNITAIFLVESGIFGLFGGAGGAFLGFALAKIIEIYFQVHPMFYLKASITPQLIFFSLLFSFLIGCISGYLPSRSAAKMKPVDALRYE